MGITIRLGRDSDGPAVISLIWSCWLLYPGLRMDVDQEMPELHALATYYTDQGGAFWVAEADGSSCGMVAARVVKGNTWEICRVYVDPSLHGSGLAHTLLDTAEGHAIAAGAERLVLWSDTRFDRAHRFYEKRSYVRSGGVRALQDISHSLEFGYGKPLNGIETLDIASATSAVARLAAILVNCVAAGGSVSFRSPLATERARAFWLRTATDVAGGRRVILAAWRDGVLMAAGILDLVAPETQPHLARVQQILVDPRARRSGLGRAILGRLESIATAQGRSLLTLDARAGSVGEALFRSAGWQETGRIPGSIRDSDGTAHGTVLFWKSIEPSNGDAFPA